MSIPLPRAPSPVPDLSSVTLKEGPPTRGELAKFYPARYTWQQLKDFMKSGDLGLLKRDPALQNRYNIWAEGIKKEHGSVTSYLLNMRIGWGLSNTPPTATTSPWSSEHSLELERTTLKQYTHSGTPELMYFTSVPSADNVKILFNDWPYSIPPEISHYVVWSRLPVIHPSLVHPSVASQVDRDGLWGFTGDNPSSNDKIKEEGMTYPDVAPGTSSAARAHILAAATHIHHFVLHHWSEDKWETAWFVNPPRIQSVKDLSHIHVFAKGKQPSTIATL